MKLFDVNESRSSGVQGEDITMTIYVNLYHICWGM